MNFPVFSGMLNQFADSEALQHYYEQGGLNGLEVILVGDSDQGKILPDMVNGVHLFYHIFWMVFHVAEVTLRESFIYRYKYTNRQVIDAAIEVINILMSERDYSFDFLVENLWFSGLTMKEPANTRRLIEGIEYEKKGIMLDLGHYMNTNTRLRTPEQAVDYIHRMLDKHEKAGFPITDWVKGIHLQMSLGGSYVMKQKKEWRSRKNRLDFDTIPFWDLHRMAYEHAGKMDQHLPFIGEGVGELIRRIDPEYITFEFVQRSKEEYQQFIVEQGKLLGYV